MNSITWEDFEKVQLVVGVIVEVDDFPTARRPAWRLTIDFGNEIGLKKSSAQIKVHYSKEELLDRQVICVINFPAKQIGNFMSEVLVTGFQDENGDIVLATTDKKIPLGRKLL